MFLGGFAERGERKIEVGSGYLRGRGYAALGRA